MSNRDGLNVTVHESGIVRNAHLERAGDRTERSSVEARRPNAGPFRDFPIVVFEGVTLLRGEESIVLFVGVADHRHFERPLCEELLLVEVELQGIVFEQETDQRHALYFQPAHPFVVARRAHAWNTHFLAFRELGFAVSDLARKQLTCLDSLENPAGK